MILVASQHCTDGPPQPVSWRYREKESKSHDKQTTRGHDPAKHDPLLKDKQISQGAKSGAFCFCPKKDSLYADGNDHLAKAENQSKGNRGSQSFCVLRTYLNPRIFSSPQKGYKTLGRTKSYVSMP